MVFLLVVGPYWGLYEMRKLKTSEDPRRKVSYYRKEFAVQWLLALISVNVSGYAIFHAPGTWGWLRAPNSHFFMLVILICFAAVMVVPFMGIFTVQGRAAIRKALGKFDYLLPESTARDYIWFGILCITAGVCEECLFRAFLMHYLASAPWHLPLAIALILSGGVFGLNHLYQGLSGMAASAVLGVVFGLIFIATGSILLPMVLHALVDLRALALVIAARPRASDELAA
jgi:membrane protease YdiL (CAAX protease family)